MKTNNTYKGTVINTNTIINVLRYKTKTRPGLVALYDIRPGNGAGQFLQSRSPQGLNCPGKHKRMGKYKQIKKHNWIQKAQTHTKYTEKRSANDAQNVSIDTARRKDNNQQNLSKVIMQYCSVYKQIASDVWRYNNPVYKLIINNLQLVLIKC